MSLLGSSLSVARHHEEALSVKEARLSLTRRVGGSVESILAMQNNLANTYANLGRLEEASRMQRDVHSGRLKLLGAEDMRTMSAASNYAATLKRLRHFEEAKSFLLKIMPMARRVLGDSNNATLRMRSIYAMALFRDEAATLDDLREAVTTLEDTERIARRVLGGAHPLTVEIERELRDARAALRAREATQPSGGA